MATIIPLTVPSSELKRQSKINNDSYRTPFDRDRDRILYSKEFRRANGKTQVFISSSDNVRTRLTHTLEVSQIARISAKNLFLDETLAEAIALGHDVGHTPLGHVGERVLRDIMCGCDTVADFQKNMTPEDKGFKHNWQSIRVLCDLESLGEHRGLTLSNYTLWGIANHTSQKWKKCNSFFNDSCCLKINPISCEHTLDLGFYDRYKQYLSIKSNDKDAWSFEGFLVRIADEIAQRHHDVEDGIYMGLMHRDEIIDKTQFLFSELFNREDLKNFNKMKESASEEDYVFIAYLSKFLVHFYNHQLIDESQTRIREFCKQNEIKSTEDFHYKYNKLPLSKVKNIISFPKELELSDEEFQRFLSNRILHSFAAQRMDGKGRFVIRRLFKAYLTNPNQLHDSTILRVFDIYGKKFAGNDVNRYRDVMSGFKYRTDTDFNISLLRGICDHLAGMTDDFALAEYTRLYN